MDELKRFIERYRASWEKTIVESGNVDGVNEFFHLPCIFIAADGAPSLFRSTEDISAFHRSRLELFRKGGVTKPRTKDFDVLPLGTRSALISVSWELRRADDSIERAWRHSYNVLSVSAGWKILVSTFQAGA